MSHENSLRSEGKAPEFVNIHGRDISVVVCEKSGELLVPLDELKQTGFGIYQKSQYAKLPTIKKQFNEEFHLHMLEAAKSYMLNNRIAFREDEILKSINNCKKLLTENNNRRVTQHNFFKNRQVEEKSDNEILIQVSNTSPKSNPQSPVVSVGARKSPNLKGLIRKSPVQLSFNDSGSAEARVGAPRVSKQRFNGEQSREESKKEEENGTKLRHPRIKAGEGPARTELKDVEHEVVVTCIDKRNCAWVRDKANIDLFENIHEMVNDEAKHQKLTPKPWQMDKVYMAPDEGSWFRCKITRYSPLTVFFVDYGNVCQVDEIRNVSEKLAKTPCMAVRITFRESEYDPCLEDEIRIKILKQNEDATYFVNVLEKIEPQPTISSAKNYFKMPQQFCTLQHGQRVTVMHEENGTLYLRTKACFETLKQIEKGTEDHVKSAPPLETAEINQLVLCASDDGQFYRAVVISANESAAKVRFLDYFESRHVDLATLRNITEALSLEPITYIRGRRLRRFEDRELSEACVDLVRQLIKSRKKHSVVLEDNLEFDLFDGDEMLSDRLTALDEGHKRVKLKDMKTYEPEFGPKSYLCGCFKSSSDFSLVPSDALQEHIDYVLRSEIDDPVPYTPIVGEVCLCYFVDHWYRCLVTRILNDEFEVVLLDFGNVEVLKRGQLRKPDAQIRDVPILALPCTFVDLPEHPNVEDLLKKKIIDGELYKANVKRISNGKFEVEIPSVYQKISSLI